MQFQIGDVVCLKSGGADMMVDELSGDEVICIWNDSSKRTKVRKFKAIHLERGGKDRGLVSLTIVVDPPTAMSLSAGA